MISSLTLRVLLFAYFSYAMSVAMLMPSWGKLDEPHHYDYVDRLATGRGVPDIASDLLTPSLAAEMVAGERWSKLDWPMPDSTDPAHWGLEGISYEGHQPALFYSSYALISRALSLPTHTDRLFLLRAVSVVVSTLSVALLFMTMDRLFPRNRWLVSCATAIFVLAPGRLVVVTQVSNDVFAEFFGVAAVYVSLTLLLRGLSPGRVTLLLLILGGAAASKTTTVLLLLPAAFAFLHHRRNPRFLYYVAFSCALGVVLLIPTFLHLAATFAGHEAENSMATLSLFGRFNGNLMDSGLLATAGLVLSGQYTFYMFDPGALRAVLFAPPFWIVSALVVAGIVLCFRPGQRAAAEETVLADFRRVLVFTFVLAFVGLQVLAHTGVLPPADARFLLPYLWGPVTATLVALMAFSPSRALLCLITILILVLQALFMADGYFLEYYHRSDFAVKHGGFLSAVREAKPAWVLAVLSAGLAAGILLAATVCWLLIGSARRSPGGADQV